MAWPSDLARAIRFLTLVPVGDGADFSHRAIAGSLYLFPAAGLLIGVLSTAGGIAAHYLFGAPVHAVAAVAVSAVVTGGFHLDGLADTGDAVFSWRDRDRRLEIMTDSRIGSLGAIALILVIASKMAALLALGEQWWIGALLCPAFGRWTNVYAIARFPAAKQEGLAAGVRPAMPHPQLVGASAWMLVFAVPLFFQGDWYAVILASIAALLVVHWLASTASKSLGGLTGDVYGALSELGEVTALLAVCIMLD